VKSTQVDGIKISLPKDNENKYYFYKYLPPPLIIVIAVKNIDTYLENRESYKGEGTPPFHSPAGLWWENEMKCRFGLAPKKNFFQKFLN
jgi:hypothetical protein